MSLLEFLGAMRGHYAHPTNSEFLYFYAVKDTTGGDDITHRSELLERDKTLRKQTEPAHHGPQAENYQSQRPPRQDDGRGRVPGRMQKISVHQQQKQVKATLTDVAAGPEELQSMERSRRL
jgi:hypothetical protein